MSKGKRKLKIETVIETVKREILNFDDCDFRFAKVGVNGEKIPVLISDDKVCSVISKKRAMQTIKRISHPLSNEMQHEIANPEIFLLSANTASQIFDSLEILVDLELRDKIKPFCFESEDCHTFCRLPFDYVSGTPLPERWANLLGNFTNTEAVCMWIGSLFFPDSDRSQYLWLYGRGGNGKSTLARVISDVLGQFVRYEQAPSSDDKYWTNGLIGKRLIVIDDCNNYGFVKTGLFKSLTGSSKVRVEAKYGTPYDVDLDCKFLFTSNELPMVSSEIADQRRLIFSAAKNSERFAYDAHFESDLRSSLGDFVSYCMDQYAAACADRRPIPVDASESEELADIFNEEVAAWLNQVGEFDQNSRVTVYDFVNAINLTKLNKRHVYKYLETKGVFRTVATIGQSSVKVLKGFKLKVYSGRF